MNSKEREFFDKLYTQYLGKSKMLYQIVLAIGYILVGVGCSVPAQETMLGKQNKDFILDVLPIVIAFGSSFAVSACVAPFRTYTEQNIKNNVGSVIVLLQYHPIDKIKIQKQKVKYQFHFLLKFSLFTLIVQLVFTYMTLETIEWINFAYIFITVFMAPAIFEILTSWIKIKVLYGEKSYEK